MRENYYNNRPLGTISTHAHGIKYIKIAQPNKWESLGAHNWKLAHPEQANDSGRFFYLHLDADKQNDAPENIERLTPGEMMMLNRTGGPVPNDADATRVKLAAIRLKKLVFDKSVELDNGLVYVSPQGMRVSYASIQKSRAKQDEKIATDPIYAEHVRKARNKRQLERYHRLLQDPEQRQRIRAYQKKSGIAQKEKINSSPELLERRRKHQREYYHAKRAKAKAEAEALKNK